ncbi:MAG: hypothetical protein R3D29_01390 [Nitratireductor sp.]
MMKAVIQWFAMAVIAILSCAMAQETEMDGLTYDIGRNAVRAAVSVSGNDNDGYVAKFTLSENGAIVANAEYTDIFAEYGLPEAKFVEMDNANDTLEVYVSHYTGGAHCCAEASVFTKPRMAGSNCNWAILTAIRTALPPGCRL